MPDIKEINSSLKQLAKILTSKKTEVTDVKDMMVSAQHFEKAMAYREIERAMERLTNAIDNLVKLVRNR